MQNEDMKILQNIYKGSEMGIFAFEDINEKTDNGQFTFSIDRAKNQLESFRDKVKYELIRHGHEPKEISRLQKFSADASISFSTMFDDSAENLSSMLIKGNEMGEEKMSRQIDNKQGISKETKQLCLEFIDLQKKQKEEFSKYLH
jgi:hypothetical protein